MLTYLNTNLFKSPAQALVNAVNTVGVMGKGIALEFKNLYPDMYAAYRHRCKAGQLTIGKLFIYRTPNKVIVNFPTKQHWRQRSKVAYIQAGLEEFTKRYQDYSISSISFPQLGCGNGELDWETEVKPIMEQYLKPLPIPVYIHLFPNRPDFVPERLDTSYVQQLQSEREIIPFIQVWNDLQAITAARKHSNGVEQIGSFSDEMIKFKKGDSDSDTIYRQDIEDLWNTLRLTGTVSEDRVPEPIRADGMTEEIFRLLAQLPYVDVVELRPAHSAKISQGLQYDPPAKAVTPAVEELVV